MLRALVLFVADDLDVVAVRANDETDRLSCFGMLGDYRGSSGQVDLIFFRQRAQFCGDLVFRARGAPGCLAQG